MKMKWNENENENENENKNENENENKSEMKWRMQSFEITKWECYYNSKQIFQFVSRCKPTKRHPPWVCKW